MPHGNADQDHPSHGMTDAKDGQISQPPLLIHNVISDVLDTLLEVGNVRGQPLHLFAATVADEIAGDDAKASLHKHLGHPVVVAGVLCVAVTYVNQPRQGLIRCGAP